MVVNISVVYFLAIMKKCAVNIYVQILCRSVFFYFSLENLEIELLGHSIDLCLTLQKTSNVSQSTCTISYSFQEFMSVSVPPQLC